MFKLVENRNSITLEHLKNFDLSQTLDCGQCFRWVKLGNNVYKGMLIKRNFTAFGLNILIWKRIMKKFVIILKKSVRF